MKLYEKPILLQCFPREHPEPFFTLVEFCPYLLVFLLCMVHFFVFVTHECLRLTIRYLRGFLGILTQTRSQVSIFGGAQCIFEWARILVLLYV